MRQAGPGEGAAGSCLPRPVLGPLSGSTVIAAAYAEYLADLVAEHARQARGRRRSNLSRDRR